MKNTTRLEPGIQPDDSAKNDISANDVTGSETGQVLTRRIRTDSDDADDLSEVFIRNRNSNEKAAPMLKVRLFGNLCDLAGQTEINLPVCSDMVTLKETLYLTFPHLKQATFAIAVNRKIVSGNQSIHTGDEIALLPPFSGG
jgi:molybdopterin synthase sulfur carrier subunit